MGLAHIMPPWTAGVRRLPPLAFIQLVRSVFESSDREWEEKNAARVSGQFVTELNPGEK